MKALPFSETYERQCYHWLVMMTIAAVRILQKERSDEHVERIRARLVLTRNSEVRFQNDVHPNDLGLQ